MKISGRKFFVKLEGGEFILSSYKLIVDGKKPSWTDGEKLIITNDFDKTTAFTIGGKLADSTAIAEFIARLDGKSFAATVPSGIAEMADKQTGYVIHAETIDLTVN